MSLKAKIEAVIYASEEPVTLQQLVSLLSGEAQAELDAADARQGELPLLEGGSAVVVQETEAGDHDALNAETLGVEVYAAVAPAPDEIAPASTEAADSTQAQVADPEAGKTEASAPTEATPTEVRARERRLREFLRSVLDELIADYATEGRGLEIREIAGGFRFATKPEYHDAVRGFVKSLKPPLKLSLQALETLAVVAYKQPVTAPEVSEIRGVDSGGVLGSLMARKLVTTAGRKQVIGRPILYKTTKEFLLRFGLKDLSELPSIEEFERFASDLNEAVQEEIPMPERLDEMRPDGPVGDAARGIEPMRGEHEAQADGIPSDEVSSEALTPPPDGPSEFTGDASVPPSDNVEIDGRISGVPPNYNERNDEVTDSPALDAEVQRDAEETAP
ncbi:MAG TPA: SMC-Scp complex subunit ScpB [Acidobacteriaceae bacterium]|nr:SMC-Scp complex subunit ScpB [Acidobacteriaceae bacterium]